MTTDWKALCARMADELDHYRQLLMDDRREVHALATEARAVLARWGRPTPQPVPVAERLPGPEDCDEKGRCWWWHPSHPESGYSEGWMLRPRAWGAGCYDFDDRLMHTHWLPAHALPLP